MLKLREQDAEELLKKRLEELAAFRAVLSSQFSVVCRFSVLNRQASGM
jgi:hypothetical protein